LRLSRVNTPHAMQCRKTSTQVHDVCIAIILVSVMIPRYLQKGRKWIDA
jgi:hypothetical protein